MQYTKYTPRTVYDEHPFKLNSNYVLKNCPKKTETIIKGKKSISAVGRERQIIVLLKGNIISAELSVIGQFL